MNNEIESESETKTGKVSWTLQADGTVKIDNLRLQSGGITLDIDAHNKVVYSKNKDGVSALPYSEVEEMVTQIQEVLGRIKF